MPLGRTLPLNGRRCGPARGGRPRCAGAGATVGGCPLLPRAFPTNQRIDHLPTLPSSGAVVASIGLDEGLHADFGSGRYEGRPIGIPYDVVSGARRAPAWLRLRGRVRPRAATDPARRPHRGRRRRRRRPPRAAGRPRRLPAVRAVRPRRGGRGAGARLGRQLEPALEQGAPRGLDERRRRRPADPAAARAPPGGRPRADRPRAARDRQPLAARVRLPGAALRVATPTRRCRGWASGCG